MPRENRDRRAMHAARGALPEACRGVGVAPRAGTPGGRGAFAVTRPESILGAVLAMVLPGRTMAAYAYVEQFGQEAVSGLVLVDNPPRPLTEDDPPGWTDGGRAVVKGFVEAVAADQLATARDFIPWMFTRELAPSELEWMLAETMLTPGPVAVQLLYDGWMGDHRETLSALTIPVLHVVRAENEAAARALLAEIHLASEVAAFGGHAMFYEFPGRFNALLADFVARLP